MRVYRWLSKCFPAAFRAEYQAELEAAAADLLNDEGAKGPLRRARLWIGLYVDAITRGFAERRSASPARASLMRSMTSEWRQAVRATLSRPATSIIAIALLGLGMGANAAVFGVVNATLLRPLPFREPDRLAMLWERYSPMHLDTMPWSDADFTDVRAAKSLAGAAIFRTRSFVLTGQASPARVRALAVEGGLFDVLGAGADRGRLFTEADSDAARDDIIVLTHAAWVNRFNADPEIVGKSILLDNRPRTVIGVLAAGVSFPPPVTFSGQMLTIEPELYLPYTIDRSAKARGTHSGFAIARLRDGVAPQAAGEEIAAIGRELERRFPDSNADVEMHLTPLHGQSVVTFRSVLFLLLGAVAGVLLIACASISNLMLARASGRAREMALRTALGAGRASIVRQLLFESTILGAGGLILGLFFAEAMSKALFAINPIELPAMFQATLDWRVLGFSVAMMLGAVVVFGLAPSLSGSRADLVSMLRSGTRSTSTRGERRTKAALVVIQVALAVVLLVGSGLTIRSLTRLWQVDPGFKPDNVVTTALRLPDSRYGAVSEQRAFQERWLTAVRRLPGITHAASMTMLPFSFDKNSSDYTIVGEPKPKSGDYQLAVFNYVSADFAGALGVPVIEGRSFQESDTADSPAVTVISESLARRHWAPGLAPGHQLRFTDDPAEAPKTIVGVVGDVRMGGFDAKPEATIYVPMAQSPVGAFWTTVSTSRAAEALSPDLRGALREIDPALPLDEIRP
ncbi:MAG: FtsX-like permease family protein, partial [Acidobacteria bacterium]